MGVFKYHTARAIALAFTIVLVGVVMLHLGTFQKIHKLTGIALEMQFLLYLGVACIGPPFICVGMWLDFTRRDRAPQPPLYEGWEIEEVHLFEGGSSRIYTWRGDGR